MHMTYYKTEPAINHKRIEKQKLFKKKSVATENNGFDTILSKKQQNKRISK